MNKDQFVSISIIKGVKEKAIAFAEWLSGNGYQQYDGADRWISQEVSGNSVFTTEQLYK